jgi:hypothetical protein
MSSANVSLSFYTQLDVMNITDDIHINSQRLHFSVHTMAKECMSFVGVYRHKYLVLKRKILNIGEKNNLIH